jgi:hypothetical protein
MYVDTYQPDQGNPAYWEVYGEAYDVDWYCCLHQYYMYLQLGGEEIWADSSSDLGGWMSSWIGLVAPPGDTPWAVQWAAYCFCSWAQVGSEYASGVISRPMPTITFSPSQNITAIYGGSDVIITANVSPAGYGYESQLTWSAYSGGAPVSGNPLQRKFGTNVVGTSSATAVIPGGGGTEATTPTVTVVPFVSLNPPDVTVPRNDEGDVVITATVQPAAYQNQLVWGGAGWTSQENGLQRIVSTANVGEFTVLANVAGAPQEQSLVRVVFPEMAIGPTDVLYLSTGDTNRSITTTVIPTGFAFSRSFSVGSMSNPNSTCAAAVDLPTLSGAGTVNHTVTASPAGCSRILDEVRGNVPGGIQSPPIKVIVPPQIMIRTVLGEAGGQPGDLDQQSLLVVARNRFGDSAFPGGTASTWQDVLIPSQFYGANDSTANGPDQELLNAGRVFAGEVGDIIGGAKCYWSPTTLEWTSIQAALNSGTATFPSGTGAPSCWSGQIRQIVVKSSLGLNVSGGSAFQNAPVFVFLRLRPQAQDPAVISIP